MAVSSLAVTLTLLLTISAASAAHHAPAPGVDCTTLVLNLADCLPYVSVGGGDSKPQGQCCSGLKTVIKTDAECICEAFKNSAQLGVTLNMTKAMDLPAACHVSAPPLSNCGLSIGSGAAPALAPSPSAYSPSAVGMAPTATAGGQELAPAPGPGRSGSCGLTVSVELLLLTTLAALFYISL